MARDLNAIRRRFPARRSPPLLHHADVEVDFGALLTRAESLLADVADSLQGGADGKLTLEEARQSVDDLAAEWNAGADAKPPGEELSARFREAMAAVATRTRDRERAQDLLPNAKETSGSGHSRSRKSKFRIVRSGHAGVAATTRRCRGPDRTLCLARRRARTRGSHGLEAAPARPRHCGGAVRDACRCHAGPGGPSRSPH